MSVFAVVLLAWATSSGTGVPPAQAFEQLKAGNERFASGGMLHPNVDQPARTKAAQKQEPFAAIVACADSRVAPELIFDQGLGDLFVVRVAGNVVDTNGLASLEYAVEHLGVRLIVVLGHSKCGAVSAALAADGHPDDENSESYIPSLIAYIHPAVRRAKREKGDLLTNAIRENELLGAARVRRAKGLLSRDIREGKVKVVSGVYDLATCRVKFDN